MNLTVLEPISFKEALSRIRMILFNSSPLDPYWVDRKGSHLVVERLTDLHRRLPEEHMFRSLDALWEADLPDDELVMVIYTPDRPLGHIRQARDFLPDYVRITPLAGQNSLTIFALVKDIKKYLRMIVWVPSDDPRLRVKIPVHHLLPSVALEKLSKLMDLGSAAAVPPPPSRSRTSKSSRSSPRQPSPLDHMKTPEMTILPDDDQRILIVWAMPRKINEIKDLLPFVDVESAPDEAYTPTVIPVKNAKASDLIETLRQIISHSPTRASRPGAKKPARRIKAGSKGGQTIATDRITMFVHPSQNAIVVIADDEDVSRIRRYMAQFDVSTRVEAVRIDVAHRDPAGIVATLGLMFGGGGKGVSRIDRFQVVPDPANGVIWFTGPESELENVREIVASLDKEGEDISLHIYRLQNQLASFVANMLRQYAGDRAGPMTASKVIAKNRARPVSVSRFTADDERDRLFVICTEKEWEEYVPIIEQLDRAVDDSRPPFVRLAVNNVAPQVAVDRLASLFVADPKAKAIRYIPTDGGILVIGAEPDQIEDVKAFLVEMDRDVVIEERVFEIRHGDPSEIRQAIETLVGGVDKASARRPKGKSGAVSSFLTGLTIVELGNRLLVRATPGQMAEVARHIATMDIPGDEPILRVYTFERGVNVEVIADELATVMSNSPGKRVPKKGRVRGGASAGAQFIPQPEVGRLIVIAREADFPRIEEIMEVLRVSIKVEPDMVALIELEYADPETLVELITPLLDIKVRALIDQGELVVTDASSKGSAQTPRRKGRTPSTTQRFHLDADMLNNRLIVAGPVAVVEEARRLVAEFDKQSEGRAVTFRIVALENATAIEVVKAVKAMMGMPGRGPARPRHKDSGSTSSLEPDVLSIVEAPGSGAVVLNGPTNDVETATQWIEILDKEAATGKVIQVFTIENADIESLAELILNVVDAPPKTAGRKAIPRPRASVKAESFDDFEFELTKTWTGLDIYLRADLVANTLLVAAPGSKMTEITSIIEEFDKSLEDGGTTRPEMPKLVYELKHRDDTYDAVFDCEMAFDALWDPPNRLPQVDYASIGNILVIRYPDKDRFPEIEAIIAKYVDKPSKEKSRIVRTGIQAPRGMSPTEFVLWLKMRYPELEIDVVDRTPADDQTYDVVQLQPVTSATPNPCYLPLSLLRYADQAMAAAIAVQATGQDQDEKDKSRNGKSRRMSADEMIRKMALDVLGGGTIADRTEEQPAPGKSAKLKVTIDNSTGRIIIEGPAGIIEDVPDWVDEMKEEIEGLDLPPDFRIYRVKHIDVFTAAEILGEMYNATRQQIQSQQRQQQQQRQRQQQAARQRQQQQQQQGAKGQPQRQPQRAQQQPQVVAQLPPTAVRIYPNPRDRSLILRAETHQYPVILKLLATIDRPQPFDSEFRTYKLEKLNAADVEAMLRDFLGIDASGGAGRRTSQPQARGGAAQRRLPTRSARSGAGSHLPRPLMQDTLAGPLAIDPKDIKLSSNEAMNTIVAMAPVLALDYIAELIEQFESEEIPERITKYYELQHADSEEVADQMTTHFENASGRFIAGGKGKQGASRGGSLNTPSFLPYPRLNMLTVLATAEQHEEVTDIIARLDVGSEQDRWQDVSLHHVKAKVAADTLTSMFGTGGRGGRSGKSGGREPKFIGSEDGRTLFFRAVESLHERILETVAKLEKDAEDSTTLRVIELAFAKPSDVASAISEAYGQGRGGRGGRGAGEAQFTVTSHDPSKRLFIRTNERLFTEIESLVQSLDKAPTFGFEFRIFPLQYAEAKNVHTLMTDLMTDYMKKLDPAIRKSMAAFSVEVDEKANALIVLGNPIVFSFLEKTLPIVDTPANQRSPRALTMIALVNADAGDVSQSINQLWSEKALPAGEIPPIVQAIVAQNAVLIRGTERQIAEIRAEVIEPLEEQIPPGQITRSISLAHADPGRVETAISRLFAAAAKKPQDKVIAVADYGSNSIIVATSAKMMKRVEELIAGLDEVKSDQQGVHIVLLKHVDPEALVRTLTEMFIRSMPQPKSGQGAALTITALQGSKALLIRARPEAFAEIQDVVAELDREEGQFGEEVRVVTLLYSDVGEMHSAMQEYLRRPGAGGKGKGLAGDIRISALTQSNSLMISGGKEEVDRLEATIHELDKVGEKGSVPQIIPLEYVAAGEIAADLQEMFTQKSSRRGQSPPVIIPNEASNILIVKAGPSDFAAITGMIEQLDVEEEKNPTFVLIPVAPGINVEDLAPKVEQTVNDSVRSSGRGRGGDVPSITVQPDRRTNTLLVSGSYSLFKRAEELVQAMEKMGPSGGKSMRIIQLGNVPADDILRLIDRLKGGSSGGKKAGSSRRKTSSRPKAKTSRARRGGK